MSEFGPGESIVLGVDVSYSIYFPLVGEEVSNLWLPKNPWVEKERTVEQIVMRGWKFLMETCFEKYPRIKEAVDAWQT